MTVRRLREGRGALVGAQWQRAQVAWEGHRLDPAAINCGAPTRELFCSQRNSVQVRPGDWLAGRALGARQHRKHLRRYSSTVSARRPPLHTRRNPQVHSTSTDRHVFNTCEVQNVYVSVSEGRRNLRCRMLSRRLRDSGHYPHGRLPLRLRIVRCARLTQRSGLQHLNECARSTSSPLSTRTRHQATGREHTAGRKLMRAACGCGPLTSRAAQPQQASAPAFTTRTGWLPGGQRRSRTCRCQRGRRP